MRPTYPLTCFLLEPQAPESTVQVRRGASGRIRTYDLGTFSDAITTITHSAVKIETWNEVFEFWKANRGQLFNVIDHLGDHWIASFLGKPDKQHIDGIWYYVVVKVVRYDPREGGL
ncbi:MAG: hypothetical protein R3E64_03985 [Halioglobus sp.]